MKKSLLSLLIFALIFTMAAPAFANTSEDLGEYQGSLEVLTALGVFTGHGDGSFKPNDTITRAEFSAVAVRLLGLEAAAQVSAGPTSFKDAIPNWATGYVNVASNQGIVKGHGDGTFKPNDPVTQAEALTMLTRVLGYEPAVSENQTWPTNYLVTAANIGLTEGVTVASNAPAPRGVVALFAENALYINKMVQVGFGSTATYAISGTQGTDPQTILGHDLKAGWDLGVVKATALNEDNQLVLVDGNVTAAANFSIAGDNTLAGLLGHQVAYLEKGGKALLVLDIQASSQVKSGSLTATTTVGSDVYFANETYASASDLVVYYNNVVKSNGATLASASSAEVFFNADGEVRFIVASKYSQTNSLVTTLGQTNTQGIARVDTTGGSFTINNDTKFTVNGESATYADLGTDFVVDYVLDGTAATIVDATDKVVTGEVTSKSNRGGDIVRVDGVAYELLAQVDYTNIVVGEEFTLYLNASDKVAKAEQVTGVTASSTTGFYVGEDFYTEVNNGRLGDDVVDYTFVTLAGEELTQRAVTTTQDVYKSLEQKLVTFTLNTDGNVSGVTAVAGSTVADGVDSISTSTQRVTLDSGTTYRLTAGTKVLNATGFDGDAADVTAINVADIKAGWTVVLYVDGIYVTHIVVTDDTTAASADQAAPVAGIYKESFTEVTSATDVSYYTVLNVGGVDSVIEVTETGYNSLNGLTEGTLVAVVDGNGDGKFNTTTSNVTAASYNATDSIITDGLANDYYVTSETDIYVVTMKDGAVKSIVFGTKADIELATASDVTVMPVLNDNGTALVLSGDFEASVVVVTVTE